MQTVIRGVSQLQVTRSRMAPGSSAGTGGRRTSRLPAEAVQPPCHLFRRGIEAGLLPYAAARHIGVLACGPLARGLLGGTITAARRPLSGRHDMTTIQPLRAARRPGEQPCPHRPRCPSALAHDRSGARTRASHPEQGWSLLCNGVVIFDDGGALLPGGRAVPPPPARARTVAPAA
jgi:hypothetical protein